MRASVELGIIFALCAVAWFAVPGAFVRFRHRQARVPHIAELSLDDLPPEHRRAQAFLLRTKEMLEELGFEYAGTTCARTTNANLTYQARLVHAETRTLAHALYTIAARRGASSVAFETELAGRSIVMTHNATTGGVFPAVPRFRVYVFDAADPIALRRKHALIVEHGYGAETRVLPASKDLVALARERARESTEHLIAVGWFEPAGTDLLRPTWKGAYLASWNLIWPIKQLRRAARARRASRALPRGS